MKLPKKFDKMSLIEQEDYLVKELVKANALVDKIKENLAKVRGGFKIRLITEERTDLEYAKEETY